MELNLHLKSECMLQSDFEKLQKYIKEMLDQYGNSQGNKQNLCFPKCTFIKRQKSFNYFLRRSLNSIHYFVDEIDLENCFICHSCFVNKCFIQCELNKRVGPADTGIKYGPLLYSISFK